MKGRQDSYVAEHGAVVGFDNEENDSPQDESHTVADVIAMIRENTHEMGSS
jgi:hypothetical protein